jgi:hypothetical protein
MSVGYGRQKYDRKSPLSRCFLAARRADKEGFVRPDEARNIHHGASHDGSDRACGLPRGLVVTSVPKVTI